MRASLVEGVMEIGEESNGLDRFAQTHLVAEDHRHSPLEHMNHPTDALELMRMELCHYGRRRGQ